MSSNESKFFLQFSIVNCWIMLSASSFHIRTSFLFFGGTLMLIFIFSVAINVHAFGTHEKEG